MFIVIEGIDNSGKTTLINFLKNVLIDNPLILKKFSKVCFTSEPYGPKGETTKFIEISKAIFSKEYSISAETESLLFLAARNENLEIFIRPKLKENSLIICDRYFLSTLAYQAYLKKVDFNWLNLNMNFISNQLTPDLIFVIGITKEDWKRNINNKKKQKQLNKLDCLSYSFEELIEAYDWASKKLQEAGENIVSIPNSLSLLEKSNFIISKILDLSIK
ncbi:dTMP kinase [Mycoplasma parvum]|uniref:Thymidylate kinase n=1 Tax=Mycoplasma parvum str. Indiana TaxID=1403316 RepID=U5NC36_9MOLU|nr:dTMP kinase [Mycoplasma parvum]AGX88845.1 hypothetical protein PRV_00350 [Mycoplasma parvum str. Indiana]